MVHENMSKSLVLVFAGPNGSGKSTLTKFLPSNGVYVNADELRREHALTELEAAQKAEALRNRLVEKKADFTFETVLSTERNLLLLKNARENGYEVQCVYVLTCNADINVARIKGRVRAGGHNVPEDKIRSRYRKALELLPQVIGVCDRILIYDNSVTPLLLFKKDENGCEYYPNEIWPLEKLKNLVKKV
jgi:predicted ABC-type ATPase